MSKDNPEKVQTSVSFMVHGVERLMHYHCERIDIDIDGSGVLFLLGDEHRVHSCTNINAETWDVKLGRGDTCIDLRKQYWKSRRRR